MERPLWDSHMRGLRLPEDPFGLIEEDDGPLEVAGSLRQFSQVMKQDSSVVAVTQRSGKAETLQVEPTRPVRFSHNLLQRAQGAQRFRFAACVASRAAVFQRLFVERAGGLAV